MKYKNQGTLLKRPFLAFCLLAAAVLLCERETVGAFGNRGICLVSSHLNAVQCAVMLGIHVVLAACYIAFNRRVFHFKNLLLGKSETHRSIPISDLFLIEVRYYPFFMVRSFPFCFAVCLSAQLLYAERSDKSAVNSDGGNGKKFKLNFKFGRTL